MNLPEYQVENLERISYFSQAAKDAGIYFTIHLDENLNVADFNRSVANAYMETVKRTIEVARHLRVPVLNMHMNHGVHFTLPDRKVLLFQQYFDEYMEAFHRFMMMCEQEIGTEQIKICIENTNGFRKYEEEVIHHLLQSKVFALTWDIGHSNSSGNVDEKFILEHENKLKHFHIHDSMGDKDHMTLGTGEIDLEKRLALAKKQQCRCVVETKTIASLKQSIQWLQLNRSIQKRFAK